MGLRWVPGVGPCVPGRVQRWGVQCEHRRGTALCPWPAPHTLRSGEGGHSRASSPLSPAPSPSLPHLTVLAGVHGGAQGAAEVFDKVPGVAEGADDTVLVGAVGVGHQPFVGALGRPDGAPHLTEQEQPQGWGQSTTRCGMGSSGVAPRSQGGTGSPSSRSALPAQSPRRRAGGW